MSVVERAAELAAVYVARYILGKYIPLPWELQKQGAVVWDGEVRETFVKYMRGEGRDEAYIERCLSYLDRYMTKPIATPNSV